MSGFVQTRQGKRRTNSELKRIVSEKETKATGKIDLSNGVLQQAKPYTKQSLKQEIRQSWRPELTKIETRREQALQGHKPGFNLLVAMGRAVGNKQQQSFLPFDFSPLSSW